MEFSVSVDVSGMVKGFDGCRRRLANAEPAHRLIGREVLVPMVRENFDTSGQGQWPELAPSTLLARARNPSGKADISRAGGGAFRVFSSRRSMGPASRAESRLMGLSRGARGLTKRARKTVENVKPLIWSRALYRSMKAIATDEYVDVGTPMIKGRTLFFGRGRVPARYPFHYRSGDVNAIRRIYVRHIFGKLVQ